MAFDIFFHQGVDFRFVAAAERFAVGADEVGPLFRRLVAFQSDVVGVVDVENTFHGFTILDNESAYHHSAGILYFYNRRRLGCAEEREHSLFHRCGFGVHFFAVGIDEHQSSRAGIFYPARNLETRAVAARCNCNCRQCHDGGIFHFI